MALVVAYAMLDISGSNPRSDQMFFCPGFIFVSEFNSSRIVFYVVLVIGFYPWVWSPKKHKESQSSSSFAPFHKKHLTPMGDEIKKQRIVIKK